MKRDTTFKPLRGKRYRCKVTGKILKQSQLERHRRVLFNTGQAPVALLPREKQEKRDPSLIYAS